MKNTVQKNKKSPQSNPMSFTSAKNLNTNRRPDPEAYANRR